MARACFVQVLVRRRDVVAELVPFFTFTPWHYPPIWEVNWSSSCPRRELAARCPVLASQQGAGHQLYPPLLRPPSKVLPSLKIFRQSRQHIFAFRHRPCLCAITQSSEHIATLHCAGKGKISFMDVSLAHPAHAVTVFGVWLSPEPLGTAAPPPDGDASEQ